MALYDHRGNPVEISRLEDEIAEATTAGVRSIWQHSVASGLTPERLAGIIRRVDLGDANEYLTLAEEMEERDLHYASVLSTRKRAVGKLSITVEASSDKPEAVKDAELVSSVLTGRRTRSLVRNLLDGLGKGFAVCEIMWDRSAKQWEPYDYIWRDPRFFQFDRENGRTVNLRDEANPADGIPLQPYKFIVHTPELKSGVPLRAGLARLAAVAFMCKSYDLKDWMAFVEVFGMPIRVGKYGKGASKEEKQKLMRAVSMIGVDAACIIPESMMIEFVEASRDANGADKVFMALAGWLNSEVSKGVLGQTMTADNGSSKSQAEVHNEVREDLRDDDAMQLAETLERDLVRPIVDLNHGPRKHISEYPTVRIEEKKPEDLKLLSEALPPFIKLGMRVEESVIRDKFGLPEPAKDATLLGAPATPDGDGAEPPTPPGAGEDDEEDEEDDPEAAALNRERKRLVAKLMRKVAAGETLTADERAMMQLAAAGPPQETEVLARQAIADWRDVMSDIVEPIEELARSASSFEEFSRGLKELQGELGLSDFTRALATAAFKTRGLGDATDKP